MALQRVRKEQFSVSFVSMGAGGLAECPFFIAGEPCTVIKISEVHETAESSAASLDITVRRMQGTEAVSAGDDLLGATKIDAKAAANTVQSPALTGTADNLKLNAGDRLGFDPEAAGTEIANLVLTVELEYGIT